MIHWVMFGLFSFPLSYPRNFFLRRSENSFSIHRTHTLSFLLRWDRWVDHQFRCCVVSPVSGIYHWTHGCKQRLNDFKVRTTFFIVWIWFRYRCGSSFFQYKREFLKCKITLSVCYYSRCSFKKVFSHLLPPRNDAH